MYFIVYILWLSHCRVNKHGHPREYGCIVVINEYTRMTSSCTILFDSSHMTLQMGFESFIF